MFKGERGAAESVKANRFGQSRSMVSPIGREGTATHFKTYGFEKREHYKPEGGSCENAKKYLK